MTLRNIILSFNKDIVGLSLFSLFIFLELFFDNIIQYLFILQICGLSYVSCIEYYISNTKVIDFKPTLKCYINIIIVKTYDLILTQILYYVFGFVIYIARIFLYVYNFNTYIMYLESKKDIVMEFSQNINNTNNVLNYNYDYFENFIRMIKINNKFTFNLFYNFNLSFFKLLLHTVINNINKFDKKDIEIDNVIANINNNNIIDEDKKTETNKNIDKILDSLMDLNNNETTENNYF